MAYYNYRTEGKTTAKFAEAQQHNLEGTVELAPNVKYQAQNVYKFTGLGSVFDGSYRIQKLTRRIDTTGMTVSADVLKVPSAPPPSPAPTKANTRTKANQEYIVKKGDTLSAIAKKLTGKASNWKAIEEANRSQLVARDKRNASDKGHWIYPNQKLIIPGHLLK